MKSLEFWEFTYVSLRFSTKSIQREFLKKNLFHYPGFISTRFISNIASLYNPCKTTGILGIFEIYLCFPRVLWTVCE